MACAASLDLQGGEVRPKLRREVPDATGRPAVPSAPHDAVPDKDPQTLEGVLSRQLVTGEITGADLLTAVAVRTRGFICHG